MNNPNNQIAKEDAALLETGTFDNIRHLGCRVYTLKQGPKSVMYYTKKNQWQYKGKTYDGDVGDFLRFMLELQNH